jgi:hypothetical protein
MLLLRVKMTLGPCRDPAARANRGVHRYMTWRFVHWEGHGFPRQPRARRRLCRRSTRLAWKGRDAGPPALGGTRRGDGQDDGCSQHWATQRTQESFIRHRSALLTQQSTRACTAGPASKGAWFPAPAARRAPALPAVPPRRPDGRGRGPSAERAPGEGRRRRPRRRGALRHDPTPPPTHPQHPHPNEHRRRAPTPGRTGRPVGPRVNGVPRVRRIQLRHIRVTRIRIPRRIP